MEILPGTVFGRIVVVGEGTRHSDGHARLLCRCECGHEWPVRHKNLVDGSTSQCRYCRRRHPPSWRHGMKWTVEYTAWQQMKDRCYNNNCSTYADYGGRGISVCERWRHSFGNFLADMGCKPTNKHSLDRYPNNDGNYEPTNCRWATRTQQARNKRNNRIYTCGGKSMILKDWAQFLDVNYQSLWRRIKAGQEFESVVAHFNGPNRKQIRYITYNGERRSMFAWAQRLGIFHGNLAYHLKKGRSFSWIVSHFSS